MATERVQSNDEFVKEILEITNKNCLEWCKIINTLGLDAKTITEWKKTFKDSQEDVFEDLKGQALEVQKRLIDGIEQLLKKAEELCKILHLQMPAYGSEELSLTEEKRRLQRQVDEYEAQVTEKRKKVTALEKRQNEVCLSLGIEPQHLSKKTLPTEKEVSDLLEKIESLEQEKFTREEKYFQIREKLQAIVNELGLKPSLSLEKIVLSNNVSLFHLTDSNMKWLDEYHDSLIKQQEQVKGEIVEEWEKLQNLWDLLEEDIQARSEFANKYVGNSLVVLEALKAEVKRCKTLKSANIQKFIISLRSQMQDLWDKCHFSAEQRESFEYFHDTYYTEDLLTLHDIEVNKLKKYYNENKEILKLLEKREELWNRMLTLEECSLAPDRFKNRGGQLLKEEKERNKLHKNIPELEEKIFQLAEEYEQKTGEIFTSKGLSVQDIISRSYDTYNEEKKLKSSARKQQRELATTPGKSYLNPTASSAHRIAVTPITPPTKRKLVVPLFSDAKRKKDVTGLKSAPPKLQVNNKTIARRYSRHSYDRKKRIAKLRRISNSLQKKKQLASETSCNTTYRDFEKEMSSKQACRSTLHANASFDTLAMPLPKTPNTCNTPKPLKRKLKNQTPRTGLKLKPGQTKLEF